MVFKPHDNVGKAIDSHSSKTYNHLEISKYRFTLIGFLTKLLRNLYRWWTWYPQSLRNFLITNSCSFIYKRIYFSPDAYFSTYFLAYPLFYMSKTLYSTWTGRLIEVFAYYYITKTGGLPMNQVFINISLPKKH